MTAFHSDHNHPSRKNHPRSTLYLNEQENQWFLADHEDLTYLQTGKMVLIYSNLGEPYYEFANLEAMTKDGKNVSIELDMVNAKKLHTIGVNIDDQLRQNRKFHYS